ncbi:MAG: ABC transporter ATP-binding protein [Eubacteriales bacterium]|nr:ABC transporter ATP-binding protein [Eubacteriales bacterium]
MAWNVFRSLYTLFSRYLLISEKAKINNRARDSFVKRLLKLPYWRFESSESLDQLELIEENLISDYADNHMSITYAFHSFLRVFVMLVILYHAIGPGALVYLIMILIILKILKINNEKYYGMLEEQSEEKRYANYLRDLNYERRYYAERYSFKYTESLSREYAKAKNRMIKTQFKERLANVIRLELTDLPVFIGFFLIFYQLIVAVQAGSITTGLFTAILGQMIALLELLRYDLDGAVWELQRVYRYFKQYSKLTDWGFESDKGEGASRPDFTNPIKIENLSFQYPETERYVLNKLNLELHDGETVMLAGANGSGKSTLIKLLVGLYEDYEGAIKIGGIESKDLSAPKRHALIGTMFQDYAKYYLNLEDNVCFGHRDEHFDELLERYNLNEIPRNEILRKLADSSVDLSGGQWQRIAHARLMNQDKKILLLDEPTSALDPLEESRIYTEMAKSIDDKTCLIVSHRLGLAKFVDRIVFMDEGQTVESGSHEELMELDGGYARFYKKQRSLYYAKN